MAQPNQKAEVVLSEEQRNELESLVRDGKAAARRVRHARILLMADEDRREGRRPDWYIAERVGISERQVCRIRRRFVHEGISSVLNRKTRSDAGMPRKMDGAVEAQLVTLCCSTPPEGRQRWTLQLLADELRRLQVVTSVCRETVRQTLKKTASSRGRRNASASRKPIMRGSLRTSKKSSTSTRNSTIPPTR
jgi:transposase